MTGLYIDDHRVISPRVWRTILVNDKHRNDIYGDNPHGDSASSPAIPAATVVLLRESDTGIETLMLHRTSKVSFGGMWVFPGGRIDPEDHEGTDSELGAAYHAAARETLEETKLSVTPTHLPILRTGRHRLERQSGIQRIFSRASCRTKRVLRWMVKKYRDTPGCHPRGHSSATQRARSIWHRRLG